ncbi:hypothetical protein HPB50_017503 [Hyalomma asiaticum]|uniref:Uncharacterized protein n=1 Tax=Hyalomma asiaticum TaxID=266040 RepID=A0ACB7TK52_HYAAI|nr:hypothetical protein HPB50_017503 [Hyalomma asiaticum]
MARLRNAEPFLRPLLLLIMLLRPIAQAEAAARKDSGAGAPSLKAVPGGQPVEDPEEKSRHSELITSIHRTDRDNADSSALSSLRAPGDAASDTSPNLDPTASSPVPRSPSQSLDAESKGPALHSSAEALVQTSVETMASSSASPNDASEEEADGEQQEGEIGDTATTTTEAPPAGGFDLESNLRAVIERIFKEALPLVYRFSTGAGSSPDCMGALFKWVLAIRRLEPWALRTRAASCIIFRFRSASSSSARERRQRAMPSPRVLARGRSLHPPVQLAHAGARIRCGDGIHGRVVIRNNGGSRNGACIDAYTETAERRARGVLVLPGYGSAAAARHAVMQGPRRKRARSEAAAIGQG